MKRFQASKDNEKSSKSKSDPIDQSSPSEAGGSRINSRLLRRMFLKISFFLAIGGAAAGIVVVLLPRDTPLVSPPGYSMNIYQSRNFNDKSFKSQIYQIHLTFSSQKGSKVNIKLEGDFFLQHYGEPYQNIGSVSLNIFGKVTCPPFHPQSKSRIMAAQCSKGFNEPTDETDIDLPIQTDAHGKRIISTVSIIDPSFGFASNSGSALAELPYVIAFDDNASPFPIIIQYNISNANKYDWSVPPLYVGSKGAVWQETIVPSIKGVAQYLQGEEVTGTNHNIAAADDFHTFMAAALLGVVGGAAIVVVQELVDTIFDPRHAEASSNAEPTSVRSA